MMHDTNYFKHSILIRILIIWWIVRFISSLFWGNKSSIKHESYNTESSVVNLNSTNTNNVNNLVDQVSMDLILGSPYFFDYLMNQTLDTKDKKSMLLNVDKYIKLYPNDWSAYLYYAFIDEIDTDKSIEYINKAIKLWAKNQPVAYIIRSMKLYQKWDNKNSELDILKAKSLDYDLKYNFVYDSFGIK